MTNRLSKRALDRMDQTLGRHVERGEVPGLVSLVYRAGEVHVHATGVKTVGHGAPVQRDTLFRMTSMTKPVTAVAALMLVEECKLRLDEPVDRLLPELANRRVLRRQDGSLDDTEPAKRPLTLRDLLTFRLGFGLVFSPTALPIQKAADALDLMAFGPPKPQTPPKPDEWLRRFATLPLMHQPGEGWRYNTGSELLGILIARAADQTFDTFLRERIFEPLGMKDTGFWVPPEKRDRLVTSYWVNGTDVYDDAANSQWSRPPAFPSGGGGLVSTADDFLTFSRMLLEGGKLNGRRLLSRPSVENMTSDQLTSAQKAASPFSPGFWESRGWGFGVSTTVQRIGVAEVAGRYGWDGGLGTSWGTDERELLIGILLTQRAAFPGSTETYLDFWTSAYAALDD